MSPDQTQLSPRLPESIRQRTELARACRRDPAMLAIAEGLALFQRLGSVDLAFRSAITLRRIDDQAGPESLQGYLSAVQKLESNLGGSFDHKTS